MTDAGDADSAHRTLRLAARTLREGGALDPLAAPTASAQATSWSTRLASWHGAR
jgi:hypothetical protein